MTISSGDSLCGMIFLKILNCRKCQKISRKIFYQKVSLKIMLDIPPDNSNPVGCIYFCHHFKGFVTICQKIKWPSLSECLRKSGIGSYKIHFLLASQSPPYFHMHVWSDPNHCVDAVRQWKKWRFVQRCHLATTEASSKHLRTPRCTHDGGNVFIVKFNKHYSALFSMYSLFLWLQLFFHCHRISKH